MFFTKSESLREHIQQYMERLRKPVVYNFNFSKLISNLNFITFILKSLQKIWVDYHREIPSRHYSPISCFLYFVRVFPSYLYILSHLVYPSGSESSSRSFSLHFCMWHFLSYPLFSLTHIPHNIQWTMIPYIG